jgi:hypothetical protein
VQTTAVGEPVMPVSLNVREARLNVPPRSTRVTAAGLTRRRCVASFKKLARFGCPPNMGDVTERDCASCIPYGPARGGSEPKQEVSAVSTTMTNR